MKEITFKTNAYGHFKRNGRIEVNGEHQQMEKRLVAISFIEGKSVSGESALHIYLSPDEAEKISSALKTAAEKTRAMK